MDWKFNPGSSFCAPGYFETRCWPFSELSSSLVIISPHKPQSWLLPPKPHLALLQGLSSMSLCPTPLPRHLILLLSPDPNPIPITLSPPLHS